MEEEEEEGGWGHPFERGCPMTIPRIVVKICPSELNSGFSRITRWHGGSRISDHR
jgi:hypothetical protein